MNTARLSPADEHRPMNTVALLARTEWGPLYAAVRAGWADRRRRAMPVAVAAVCLTALLHFMDARPWGHGFVQAVGGVRAEDPLWLSLLRTPLSLFVPALQLPAWGASIPELVPRARLAWWAAV